MFNRSEIWIYSILTACIISLIGFGISIILTLVNKFVKINFKILTSILISIAVGSLLGDAFIHILPESFGAEGDGIDGTLAAFGVILGMAVFLFIEKILHSMSGHDHHDHDHNDEISKSVKNENKADLENEK